MATNLLTLQDLVDRINTLVNNDTDSPTQNDEDWDLLLNLINQSISKWEAQDVDWDELWTTYTGTTIAANTRTYSLSGLTNMRRLGGFLKLTLDGQDQYIDFVSPEQYQSYMEEVRVAYITGNDRDGFTLNLGWTPATGDGTVDATISFPYYKYATRFDSNSLTTDKTEMSDPNYIIYDVAAAKSLMESKNNQFSIYSTEAANSMDRMRAMNEITSPYNGSFMEDIDFVNGNAVLGE